MGHTSSWGVDNRGDKAVSEVLLYKDGTSKVHGVLADGTRIAYELAPGGGAGVGGGDKFVGRQLSDGYWIKARTANAVPEYILCRGEGFKLMVIFRCTDSGAGVLACCACMFACGVSARLRASALACDIPYWRYAPPSHPPPSQKVRGPGWAKHPGEIPPSHSSRDTSIPLIHPWRHMRACCHTCAPVSNFQHDESYYVHP